MKPLVFISHRSNDAELVRRLKSLLVPRTSRTIRFFVSSDRESIPAGEMWVTHVLEALDKSSLAFALLSPGFLDSQWIPFEVALCYSRGIRVVPVGLDGVDAKDLSPPLGLLQGFNLDGADALGRIVSEINAAFDHAHSTTFSAEEYASLLDAPVQPLPDGEYDFQVFATGPGGEKAQEGLRVSLQGSRMLVRSSRKEQWESIGMLQLNRYVGRFRFLRGGSSPEDLGMHDFVWNGKEFVGSARLDSGRWAVDHLIWRPVR
jgi:hypothetical protein